MLALNLLIDKSTSYKFIQVIIGPQIGVLVTCMNHHAKHVNVTLVPRQQYACM